MNLNMKDFQCKEAFGV